jgi:hypothetical protein
MAKSLLINYCISSSFEVLPEFYAILDLDTPSKTFVFLNCVCEKTAAIDSEIDIKI